MKKLLIFITIFLTCTPITSEAFTFRYSPEVIINEGEIIEENLYLMGGKTDFNNFLDQDLTVLSGKSDIKGVIFGDFLNISGESNLSGEVFGDARFLGGEVKISGNTNKDLILVAAKSFIEPGSIINGDTLILSGETSIQGKILDDLKIFAGKVYLNSEVLGDLEITTQELIIGPDANILGDARYYSPKKADIQEGAEIKEGIVYNKIEAIDETDFVKRTVLSFFTFYSIIKFLATLFIAFILVYVFRVFSQRVTKISTTRVGKSIFVGLLSLILIPVSIFILIASLFGIPLAVLILFVTLSILLISNSIIGIVLGYLIRKIIDKNNKKEVDFNSAALGIVVLTFLYFIPIIGTILKTILTIWVLGAIILYFSEIILRKKKQ